MGHHFGVMDALEQAAKEMGGAYTNRQKLEHSGDVSLHESEDFQEVLEVLMDTLENHPDARADVANALAQVGSDE
jgi:DNA-directed RNA polymerase subunit F